MNSSIPACDNDNLILDVQDLQQVQEPASSRIFPVIVIVLCKRFEVSPCNLTSASFNSYAAALLIIKLTKQQYCVPKHTPHCMLQLSGNAV